MSAQPDIPTERQPDSIIRKTIASNPFEFDILPNMPEKRRGQAPPVFTATSQGGPDGYRTCFLFTMFKITAGTSAFRELFDSGHRPQAGRHGGARRDRTDDLMLAKHALSQLSYGPEEMPNLGEHGGPGTTRTSDLTLIRGAL